MPPKSEKTKSVEDATVREEAPPEQTGDGGAREEEVSAAIEAVGALELDIGDDAQGLVADLTHYFVELFKHRPKPWSQLSQAEQRDLAAQCEHNAKETVRRVVEAVARNGREAIRCLCIGFIDKGDDIKVELKVKAGDKAELEQAVLAMHRARGKHVLVTVASAEDYAGVPAQDQSEPDQPGLGFEAGGDEVPLDAPELAEQPSDPAFLKDGDRAAFAGEDGVVRIDLKKGWIQFRADKDGEEGEWQDMREATGQELAAERERQADFAEA